MSHKFMLLTRSKAENFLEVISNRISNQEKMSIPLAVSFCRQTLDIIFQHLSFKHLRTSCSIFNYQLLNHPNANSTKSNSTIITKAIPDLHSGKTAKSNDNKHLQTLLPTFPDRLQRAESKYL